VPEPKKPVQEPVQEPVPKSEFFGKKLSDIPETSENPNPTSMNS